MIKKLTVINFQSHKKTVLRLCQGINGIIGRSNAGKSSLFRAIELVRSNRPSGFAYHSNIANTRYTRIHIKNDREDIRFSKSKTTAEYVLHRKETFRKFGRNVPDKIHDALNLDDINFSSQLGLPFLITSSSGEIARVINQVTKAEDIEKCISIAKKQAAKYKSKRLDLLAGISNLNRRLKAFRPMHKIKRILKRAELLEHKIENVKGEIDEIKKIVTFIKTAENAMVAEEQTLIPSQLIEKAELLQRNMDSNYASIALIEQAVSMRESIDVAKEEKKHLIKQYTTELKRQKKCPTCMHPITNAQLQTIREELK